MFLTQECQLVNVHNTAAGRRAFIENASIQQVLTIAINYDTNFKKAKSIKTGRNREYTQPSQRIEQLENILYK